MSNLLQDSPRVHSDRPPDDLSDAAWLHDQAAYHATRCERGEDVHGLISASLRRLAKAIRFARDGRTAADYARRHGIDLAGVWVQAPGSRRSPLAAELDVEASWYAMLDTSAGRLAAHEIQRAADAAEELGSGTVEDFLIDEAAHYMALEDAIGGAL